MFEYEYERPTISETSRKLVSKALAKVGLQFIETSKNFEKQPARINHFGDIIASDAFEYGALRADGSIEVFGIEHFQNDHHYDYVLTTQQERKQVTQQTGHEIADVMKFDVTSNDPSRAEALYVVESALSVRNRQLSVYDLDDGAPIDGWHVKARRLTEGGEYNPNGELIDFYQSGWFINRVNPADIKTVGWMNLLDWD